MTLRLLNMAATHWRDIDGYGVGHGFNPLDLEFVRFVNFMWWWFTRNAEQNEVEKFKTRLWRPPPGRKVEHKDSPWHPENENAAFDQLKSALGGRTSAA